ncbi:hypothetical protein BsIDN1_17970 [Bacillus safensis]|uniref:Uncharacterized protein n=1 Tax=Bacillus safensis TaxID=561879 RepID=A0A5S9M8A8_BACIA|nr:hypothetical protein BsIDN1_17970 [Bacillus safensis]
MACKVLAKAIAFLMLSYCLHVHQTLRPSDQLETMSSFLSKGVFTLMVYPLIEKDTHEGE